MNYNKDKVRKFYESTLTDYNEHIIIEDIVKVNITEKTDGTFTQIGIRPLVDEDMLISPTFIPELPGAGRMIAIGERDFLVKTILSKNEIKRIPFEEDIKEFPKYIFDLNDAVILFSTKFYTEIFTKLMHRIDYEKKIPRLDKRYLLIPITEKMLDNKIIIIDKSAILWDKEIFDNEITNKKEKIDIKIAPTANGKIDITIRSVNKIKYIDLDAIKILEVGEQVSEQ